MSCVSSVSLISHLVGEAADGMSQVSYVTSFNSPSFPGALALAKEDTMMIGNMDEIQKLQLRTVPLGEQPRRIAHQEASRSFAVACEQSPYAAGA